MPKSRHHTAVSFIAVVLILLCPVAVAAEDMNQQLQRLLTKIDTLNQAIRSRQERQSSHTAKLRSIEAEMRRVSDQTQATEEKIQQHRAELRQLRKTRKSYQRKLAQEHKHLSEQLYAAYILGHQEKIKLLFSQKNAADLQHNLVYYQYFSQARTALIDDVQSHIRHIVSTESRVSRASQSLQQNHRQLEKLRKQLRADAIKRKAIITALAKQLEQQGGQLKQLQQEAGELQHLVNALEDVFAEIPEPKHQRPAFASLKGKLARPVVGTTPHAFGSRDQRSRLPRQGILIKAPAGQPVRAISHGRVAFADWLRGFGNLLIIDHGESFLSLYGHNQALFKVVGDWVESGDVISSVGNSGGQEDAGLYFEIRAKGKPQDPASWLLAKK